jgi:flagellar FliL protein
MAERPGKSEVTPAPPTKKTSALGLIVPLVLLTAAAAGGGSLVGAQILAATKGTAAPEAPHVASTAPLVGKSVVKELDPIVTNLASPDGAWIRLQTAIVYDKADVPQVDLLAAKIGDDILAFVKTLTVAQIQGASGLQQLREDLNERANVRSEGRVRELMIEMLVVQ